MTGEQVAEFAGAAAPWLALVCGFVVVWWQNENAKRLTCLQLFVSLAERYDSEDMQRCRASLARKLLDEPDALEVDDRLLVFYESIAILNRRGVLDQELLANTFAIDVCGYWHAARSYVQRVRQTFDDPTLYAEMEALKDRFEQEPGYDVLLKSMNNRFREFLKMESLRGR